MRRIPLHLTLIALGFTWLALPLYATTRIRVEAGTKLPVRLDRGVSTKDKDSGKWHTFGAVRTVTGTLMQDIASSDGRVALPAGTQINVAILEDKRAGHVIGRSKLRLGLYSVYSPYGEVIPIEGYPTTVNDRKVDREGTEHGKRSLVKDAAVDVTSVTAGAAAGFMVAGPLGAALGGGGGLIVATAWTVLRRGPDITVPPGTVVEFVVGRPVSFVPTNEVIEDSGGLQTARWGRGEFIPPSEDLLALADQVNADPNMVLGQLKQIRLNQRTSVDRTFGLYLEAMARYQRGDHGKDTLKLMREAYEQGQVSPLPPAARAEMARNLVVMIRNIESDWERDPMLNNPQVQAALVEEMR